MPSPLLDRGTFISTWSYRWTFFVEENRKRNTKMERNTENFSDLFLKDQEPDNHVSGVYMFVNF